MTDLLVTVGEVVLGADWVSDNKATRQALTTELPISGDANRWGDELYFHVALEFEPDALQSKVEPGTLAYWPSGPAICLFWGRTPASTDDMPVAASPVAPFAKVDALAPLQSIEGGARMRLENAD